MFIHVDPKLDGLLLEPLFRLQASPEYTMPYAAPDLGAFYDRGYRFLKLIISNVKGTDYPNVTVGNATHSQGVER